MTRQFSLVCSLGILLMFVSMGAAARVPVSAPLGGGPGDTAFASDMDIPFSPGTQYQSPNFTKGIQDATPRSTQVGGNDVAVLYDPSTSGLDFARDSNGTLYAVVAHGDDHYSEDITVMRSVDSGTTWQQWAEFIRPDSQQQYSYPTIHVAEGNTSRVFVAWRHVDTFTWEEDIMLASSPLDETANFTVSTLYSTPDHAGSISITTDASSFGDYYVYVVFSTSSASNSFIHFTRSTDQGDYFEPEYVIAELNLSDRRYSGPKVSYGFGGYVHVAWNFSITSDSYTDAIRYRRLENYGNGGLAGWDGIRAVTSVNSDYDEVYPSITASINSNQVLVACDRFYNFSGSTSTVVVSLDQGNSFEAAVVPTAGIRSVGNIVQNPDNGNWMISGARPSDGGYIWASATNPSNWSDIQILSDSYTYPSSTRMVLDPTHGNSCAMIWREFLNPDGAKITFDAEWCGGVGFPNYQSPFPIDLDDSPISDPAVVDLNGDGNLEIIFGDSGGNIQVYGIDGYALPGWPVNVGTTLSNSPIAIGDLNGNGTLTVVAGSNDGRVFAFEPNGETAFGWPIDTGSSAPAFVAIGALGPPYAREVAVASGEYIQFLNWQGNLVVGTSPWNIGAELTHAPVFGDTDGDGATEIVFGVGDIIATADMHATHVEMARTLGSVISASPSLGDFDLDGDVEIVVPTTDGTLYLIHGDGSDFAGDWPQATPSGSPLSRAAIANFLSTGEPEIVVCSKNWAVNMMFYDGSQPNHYPVETDGWYIYGSPIIGKVAGFSTDVVIGARGSKAWSWDNFGLRNDGWPKVLENHCHLTPAMGDLDLDGYNEIVFLTVDQLIVVDVGINAYSAAGTWAMAGHDPQRTGCSDCPEDIVTPVIEDDPNKVTRISFATPSPNPISSGTTFSYAVPARAVVELAVYDIRGRRIALVKREEINAGHYVITWDGRDQQGRPLASGNYVATLRVKGSGMQQVLSRKVTVLR